MKYLLLFFVPLYAFSQSPMDSHRWYLNPEGQDIIISIDDLHDEHLKASPGMKWGREIVPTLKLKKDLVIAVIDGGIDIEHPELKDHIAYDPTECFEGTIIPPKDGEDKNKNGYKGDCAGWDFVGETNRPEDLDGHGTHVTGIIHSVMTGIQGSYKFLPLKVFAPDEGTQGSRVSTPLSTRLTKAFDYAIAKNVDVIHMSVGWPKSFMSFEVEAAIKKALSQGIAVVAAAGNSSQRATIFPCQMDGVICVGALRPNGDVARFSNWGGQVDIFAPGEKILSTIPNRLAPMYISRKGYDFKNGTSQAAPFISAAMAIFKGIFVGESSDKLYARLLSGADESVGGLGLKGLFHLDRSLGYEGSSFIFPNLKGIHSVVTDERGSFTLSIPFKNYGDDASRSSAASLNCDETMVTKSRTQFLKFKSSETKVVDFSGKTNKSSGYLDCRITVGDSTVSQKLKILQRLETPFKEILVPQSEPLVVHTKNGARSRFLTMNPVSGTIPGPLYYFQTEKSIFFYLEDKLLGSPVLPKNCKFLRVWQIDFDKDQKNEIMMESMCDNTALHYHFLDLDLRDIYPSVTYKPALTILNYEDFEVETKVGQPPVFNFLNSGFAAPTDTPWDSDSATRSTHYYEMFPVQTGETFRYDVRLLEEPKVWMKSLGLRYVPSYEILHRINDRLLVRLLQKTAWVDLKTQSAVWAGLDDVLLMGSRKQNILGSDAHVLQSLLTPFEYRGFILPGLKLRYLQDDKFDPILDVIGTVKNDQGYKTTLRTYQRLLFLQFSNSGELVGKEESTVDRFDFLTAQDLISSVVNLVHGLSMIQIVDGTKINTNYVDVVQNGEMVSYEIPANCVTQQPVILEGKATLPLFCGKTRTEFEMKFFEID